MIKYQCPDEGMKEQLIDLWRESFGDSRKFIENYMTYAYSASHCRCAVEDGTVLSALHIMDCSVYGKAYAYIYAASTAEHARGRGIFRRLLENTEEYLKALGYRGMVLSAGDDGLLNMYEKLGFSRVSGLCPIEVSAGGGEIIGLRSISAEEYVRAREKYLPAGAATPDDGMTAFLDVYAELYEGDSFVLAAVADDSFIAVEYLGDESKLPGVLAHFGCARGTFYVPRDDSRAMARVFGEATAPIFLGIAFNV